MNIHLRPRLRAHSPAYRPWVPPFDGPPPRHLNILVVGSLVGISLAHRVPPDPDVDVIVATGGLTDSALGTLRRLRIAFPRPVPIVLVLGPAEYQDSEREVTIRQARRSAAAQGVTLLDDAEAVVRGVRFIGGTLWSDFRLHGSDDATVSAAFEAAAPTFDGLDIRRDGRPMTPLESTGLHWRTRSWLGLSLPSDRPTIVVTHHAPTGTGLPSAPFMDPLAASRASRCDDLVRQSDALLWIHGGRDVVDHLVERTRVVCRPLLGTLPAMVSVDLLTGEGSATRDRLRPEPRVQRCLRSRPTIVSPEAPSQVSLFADQTGPSPDPRMTHAHALSPVRYCRAPALDAAAATRVLDGDDDYRVLRRLKPRPVDSAHRLRPGESVALLVDVETTGLDHREHEVIEIGMVAFVHDADGRVGPVVGTLGMLQEPRGEISAEITRLTGITAEMVAGRTIDLKAVRAMVESADLVIAHNAKFDRAFCEGLDDAFRHKAWTCSLAEVPWRDLGFDGTKLGYLVNGCGLFHDGHRAVDDCHALLEVLAHEVDGVTAFSHLLRASTSTRVRVWAEGAPFHRKDVLKARGYRWHGGGDGRPKAWWIEVDDVDLEAELSFLECDVHLRAAGLRRDVLTAHERHRPA